MKNFIITVKRNSNEIVKTDLYKTLDNTTINYINKKNFIFLQQNYN